MTILTGSEARGLVESMIDPETQTQMCGVELTLQKIERFPGDLLCDPPIGTHLGKIADAAQEA